ncbi:hypothetical protein TKK_0013918 [Trichogramma kaykai]
MQLGGSARVEDTKPSAACNADCCFTGAHVASIQSVSSPYDDFRRVMNNVFFPPNPTQNSGILKDFSRSRGVLPSQDVDLLNSNNFNSTHGVLPSHSANDFESLSKAISKLVTLLSKENEPKSCDASRDDYCYYHIRFSEKAGKCTAPCKWDEQHPKNE